jgi:hypothetical protein
LASGRVIGSSPSDQTKAANRYYSKIIWLFMIVKFNHRYRSICESFGSKNTTA